MYSIAMSVSFTVAGEYVSRYYASEELIQNKAAAHVVSKYREFCKVGHSP